MSYSALPPTDDPDGQIPGQLALTDKMSEDLSGDESSNVKTSYPALAPIEGPGSRIPGQLALTDKMSEDLLADESSNVVTSTPKKSRRKRKADEYTNPSGLTSKTSGPKPTDQATGGASLSSSQAPVESSDDLNEKTSSSKPTDQATVENSDDPKGKPSSSKPTDQATVENSDDPKGKTSSFKPTDQATGGASQTPEEVEKLIEYYRDPYKWSDLGVEDDGSASDSDDDDDDDDEPHNTEDEKEKKKPFMTHIEKMALIKLLATAAVGDTPVDPIKIVRNSAPKGLTINGRQLLSITHPDRYRKKDEKDLAEKAFQVIEPALAQNRSMKIEGEKTDDKVDFLEDYHEKAHIEATKCFIKLYDVYKKGDPIGRENRNLTKDVKSLYQTLDKINEDIIKQNKEIGNAADFGVVEVDQITNCWNPHNQSIAPKLLWKLCESLHYPLGWAFQPPREDYTYDLDRGESWAEVKESIGDSLKRFWHFELKELKTTSDLVKHILVLTDDCNEHIGHINAATKRPANLNHVDIVDIMAHYCGLKSFDEASMKAQFDNLRRHLEQRLVSQDLPSSWLPDRTASSDSHFKQVGSKMVISASPRTIEISMRPGYTQKGERIIAMAKVGMASARFVIEADGLRRIVDSGRAGGKRVLKGAEKVGIPCTVTSYEEIRKIEEAMDRGLAWKITYVAVGEWKTNRLNVKGLPMLPYIIVGIYILKKEHHASRSILGKLIGGKAADNLIVQALGGDEDESLIETLMSRFPMEDIPRLLTDGPRKATGFVTPQEQKQASATTRDLHQANSNENQQTDDLLAMKSEMEELKAMMSKLLLRMT